MKLFYLPGSCALGPHMSPTALVDQVMHDISHGKDEIMPGKVRFLPMLTRLAPSLTARLVAES
jgi:hypothetical protein